MTTQSREKPILFSAPMVRAIIAGTKTQTRRICKANVRNGMPEPEFVSLLACCPYGQPGDRLWVRETCRADEVLPVGLDGVRYTADGAFVAIENSEKAAEKWWELACYGMRESGFAECRSVPPIHMPRWASRIDLEVTAVRIERLQDISEADAMAEGVPHDRVVRQDDDTAGFYRIGRVRDDSFPIARYAALWDSINGPGSWKQNPWVWVVEFRRVK